MSWIKTSEKKPADREIVLTYCPDAKYDYASRCVCIYFKEYDLFLDIADMKEEEKDVETTFTRVLYETGGYFWNITHWKRIEVPNED